MRVWVGAVLGLVVALAGGAVAPTAAQASVGVIGQLDRHHVLEPNGTVRGEVWVENTHDEPVVVTAALVDYRQRRHRDQWPAAPSHPRSLAPFIRFQPAEQTVPADSRARVAFVIDLSANVDGQDPPALSGTYWAALMIRPEPVWAPTATGPGQPLHLRERFQTAVRLSVTLTTPASTELVFAQAQWQRGEQLNASDQAGDVLWLELHNTGQRLLDLDVVGEWVAGQGASLERTALGRVQIYPGGRRRLRWPLHHRPKEVHEALVVATPTERMLTPQRFGARFVFDAEAHPRP